MIRLSLSIIDDCGFTEPYTDLLALGIVTAGIVLFIYLLFSGYVSWASASYSASVKQDLLRLSHCIAEDPELTYDKYPLTFEAKKLDKAINDTWLIKKYGPPGAGVMAEIWTSERSWAFGQRLQGEKAIYSLPVSVLLNDARCLQGHLLVTVWRDIK